MHVLSHVQSAKGQWGIRRQAKTTCSQVQMRTVIKARDAYVAHNAMLGARDPVPNTLAQFLKHTRKSYWNTYLVVVQVEHSRFV